MAEIVSRSALGPQHGLCAQQAVSGWVRRGREETRHLGTQQGGCWAGPLLPACVPQASVTWVLHACPLLCPSGFPLWLGPCCLATVTSDKLVSPSELLSSALQRQHHLRRLWWGFHEMHTVPSARARVSGSALRGDCMLPFYRGGD